MIPERCVKSSQCYEILYKCENLPIKLQSFLSLLLSIDNSQVKLSGICEVKNPRLISKMAWH